MWHGLLLVSLNLRPLSLWERASMGDEKGDLCSFSDDEWNAVLAAAGSSFEGLPVIEKEPYPGEIWFASYGPPPFESEQPIERAATNADVRAYLEGQLYFAKDSSLGHYSVVRQEKGAERVHLIAEHADNLIALLAEQSRYQPILEPRDPVDPVRDMGFLDEDLKVFMPRLQIDLIRARDFYRGLSDRYRANAEVLRMNVRPVDTCREIYWGELIRLWTQALGRPPTSSPTGPLTRFIEAASAPMTKRLLPSADTIHRFARTRLRPMQAVPPS